MKPTFAHFEIPADDMERAKRFYEELLGWEIVAGSGCEPYWPIKDMVVEGAVIERLPFFEGPLFYIQVDSIDEYAAKIEGLGGKIVLPKDPRAVQF